MRKFCPPFTALVCLVLLSGCSELTPSTPPGASLNVGTIYMAGVVSEEIEITASGAWEVFTPKDTPWLTVTPRTGVGNATVKLNVDPGDLDPGEYISSVTLYPEGAESGETTTVVFSFPRLRGSLVIGSSTTLSESASLLAVEPLSSGPGTLLVGFHETAPAGFTPSTGELPGDGFRALAANAVPSGSGMSLRATFHNSRVAVVDVRDMRSAAEALKSDPNVRYVSPNSTYELLSNDPHRSKQWALDVMDVENAWNVPTVAGVNVAVIDTGFYPAHPDLKNKVVGTYDLVANQEALVDRPTCGYHGTHVAGIVAAEVDNFEGVAGVAPGAGLLLLNVGDDANDCSVLSTEHIVAAIEWVIGDGSTAPRADVINMSLGAPTGSSALASAIKAAYAAGITMIAATGNSGSTGVFYPAAYPEVIAVSATGKSDEVASYSTTGVEVFVSAPGGNGVDFILSTIYDSINDSFAYGYMQGTSMASPAAAGVAALVKSVNPGLAPIGVAGVLADTSLDLGAQGRDNDYGYGRVDAYAAVTRAAAVDAQKAGFVLSTGSGTEYGIPVVQEFDIGYVDPGPITLKVGSDDDRDGVPSAADTYYGELETSVPYFEGPYFSVTVAVE